MFILVCLKCSIRIPQCLSASFAAIILVVKCIIRVSVEAMRNATAIDMFLCCYDNNSGLSAIYENSIQQIAREFASSRCKASYWWT